MALDQCNQLFEANLLGSRRYGDNWVEISGAPRADIRSLQEVRVHVTPGFRNAVTSGGVNYAHDAGSLDGM